MNENNKTFAYDGTQISPTLTANNADGSQRMPDKDNFNGVICVDQGGGKSQSGIYEDLSPTLATTHGGEPVINNQNAVVRRLTPLECERLQGFPDGWTDIGEWTDTKGKKHKTADSSRYKALGNSIALPFWEFLAARMTDFLKSEGIDQPTMASLFDGIGGFPLVYSRHGCRPVWASEIEEFPIAVTKIHFSESED